MTIKSNPTPMQLDVRTRDRNLKAGTLTDKELEKHLSSLTDLEGSYDLFTTPQPALEQPRVIAAPAPVSSLADESSDDLDDEDDEDEDEDEDDDKDDESTDDVGGSDEGEAPAAEPTTGGEEPSNGGGEA